MRLQALLPGGARLYVFDAVLLAWAIVWLVIGLSVASEVKGLASLSDTVSNVGGAVEESGRAIRSLGDVPLVGERIAEPADRIEEAGRDAVASGRRSRESIQDLSTLLGVAVAIIPSVPLLGFYLPLRVARRRETRAVRVAMSKSGGDPRFKAFLAHRAVDSLSYRRLMEVSPEPWRDLADGRFDALARAELERLGLPSSTATGDEG